MVTDVLGGGSSIELGPDTRQPLEAEDDPGNTSIPSPNHPDIKYTTVQTEEYIANFTLESTAEHTSGVSHNIPCSPDYVINCPRERASCIAEESREVSGLSLMPCETENGFNCNFPFMAQLEVSKEKAFAAVSCCETSCVVNSLFPELVTNSDTDPGAPLIHCDTEYVLSCNFPMKNTAKVEIGVEIGKQTGNHQLPRETDVDHSHFSEGTTNKERTDNGLFFTTCNPSCVGYESDYAVNFNCPEGTVPESPQMYCSLDYVKQ